ncbi:MAG: acetyl-CoA carboxylase biotin carboxyl carrier protein subunit [Breznakibacter sp.]|nr:acetyl-CoA carboxylase biotin carboxyl carrier protein subunit [Breznakibacter sp.]
MENKEELVDFCILKRVYKTTLTKKYAGRKNWEPNNPNEIISIIPGTIISIDVKEGQTLKMGERILVLESMKMYNNICMPCDGSITKICVEPGQRIPKNHLMVEISEE